MDDGSKGGTRRLPHTSVAGVPVALVGDDALTQAMAEDCAPGREVPPGGPVLVFDSNGQGLSMAATDTAFGAALNQADIIHADGQFVVWMSRLSPGAAVPERTATTDFIHSAARRAAQDGISFFLLGGSEDVNARCAARLQELYPGLVIAGRRHGYFGEDEEAAVIAEISDSGADVVWVGLGKPKEQIFSVRHRAALRCKWLVTCGGCFNFVTGDYARAPAWAQKAGLEWVHRLATGPRYLLGRYALTVPHAIWLVLRKDAAPRLLARARGGDS
ncbi:MAG: WecB/TagA/CpsF family glycosyltransferase [Pseudomonadota bacterium]